jgi:hypothetical protein
LKKFWDWATGQKQASSKSRTQQLLRLAQAEPSLRPVIVEFLVEHDEAFAKQTIRLAHENPEMRSDLLPILRKLNK